MAFTFGTGAQVIFDTGTGTFKNVVFTGNLDIGGVIDPKAITFIPIDISNSIPGRPPTGGVVFVSNGITGVTGDLYYLFTRWSIN